jgi:hypothetical protein
MFICGNADTMQLKLSSMHGAMAQPILLHARHVAFPEKTHESNAVNAFRVSDASRIA